ncbi:Uncharacterised protein [Yersinia nurmii]|uniref:Uncharacterized protein n=1 Tax=Yersinia nurmii TaxID=685706 RepID=A0ABP1YF25_9GAMM|nr:Uncharacterised protein [Yersinia nurmii]
MSARENLRGRRSLDKNAGSAVLKIVLSPVKKQTAQRPPVDFAITNTLNQQKSSTEIREIPYLCQGSGTAA